jgi:aminoglycoside 6-adenylyltransferase
VNRYADILEELARWARLEDDVRAAIVVGSQARTREPADMWSDLDVILVVREPRALVDSATWLDRFGHVVCTFVEGTMGLWKERRVLYSDGRDVDFVLLPADAPTSAEAVFAVASTLSRGFQVLLDKDGLAASLSGMAQVSWGLPPTLAEYNNTVNDFGYHLVWAAKKLARGELWTATACVNRYLASLLLGMIVWHVKYSLDEKVDTWHAGRFLERWAPRCVVDGLADCVTHYDRADAVLRLDSLRRTYRELAESVARSLHFRFPAELFEGISDVLQRTGLADELAGPSIHDAGRSG